MAGSQTASNFSAGKLRLIKDRAARFGVTLGGGMVLIALLLIFFYLLYVVLPIFRPASITPLESYALPSQGTTTVALGMEARAEVGYRLTAEGDIEFFNLRTLDQDRQAGQVLKSERVSAETVTAFARSHQGNGDYVYAVAGGRVLIMRPDYRITYPNDVRLVEPEIRYPYGQTPLQLDPEGRDIRKLAFERDGDTLMLAALLADDTLMVARLVGRQNMLTRAFQWSTQRGVVNWRNGAQSARIEQLLLTPNLRQLFVQSAGTQQRVHVIDTRDVQNPVLQQTIPFASQLGRISAMTLLAGHSSLMVGHQSGHISQWFEVSSDGHREYVNVRNFNAGTAVEQLIPEQYRRSFYALTAAGDVAVFHTTSSRHLFQGQPGGLQLSHAVVGPRANHMLAQQGEELHVLTLRNEHPEVSWHGLWGQIWYENYDEPSYTWQSTSGSDDFEPKFSLVPISFGTIKAAFYAMLIAVPIGLAAAVYTAYFMTPSLRKVVKPTIEIMEALPTVILGFLAGLWLAPLVESHLPGFITFLLLLPLTIILAAFLWHLLPENIRNYVTDARAAMLLIPVVIFVGWLSFSLSPLIELMFFGGDMRDYLTNTLGINFDQRNALVVGIAMGFAVIPTIFSIAEDAVFSVPKHLSNGSLALGATEWQTLTRVVLLTASPGIFSAVMMGLGRAVGETMIVLMATGNTPIMDWNIFEGMRTLSANIAVEMPESEVGSTHYRILFLAAFVLFIFTFAFNTVAEFVRQRLRDKYSSL
ncbi:ABC transporter permease subunit [Aliidiomarina haloalkalitolerans]|uniref:Phosphate ABC transporter permease n=1 Tax=Aliidiomarina haloalkalitolerans TaxID=859059 RepID=A0A432VTQ8_9GAMM|nr:ABC transporter permease subunit [Aliidiomarina haloalkalitolerans]MCL4409438.1 ABC transporter permease subunit [Gammaproteobacteria bacterium]RUO19871.1 phosphate ABC transporter permease [Aliidiomarina haloalkalitolerans]